MATRPLLVSRPGEGPWVAVAGDRYRFLGVGAETDRSYMIMEAEVPPGGGPPLHAHSREEEGFYVLDGEMTFEADGETVIAGPGTFLNLPKGSRHRFENRSGRPARMLILCAPAGIEDMFREADGKEPPELMTIAARYGISIFPPG
ncbi:MAG TPA: cupin domain-containing protein [Geminicoccaceae bacterium]